MNVFDQRYGGGYGSSRVRSNQPPSSWNRDASLLHMCSLGHTDSSRLACQPSTAGIWMSITTVVPENGYRRTPEQAWSTQKPSWTQWGLLGLTERVFGMMKTRWRFIFAEFPWNESHICFGLVVAFCPLTMTVEKLCWKSVSRHVNGHISGAVSCPEDALPVGLEHDYM